VLTSNAVERAVFLFQRHIALPKRLSSAAGVMKRRTPNDNIDVLISGDSTPDLEEKSGASLAAFARSFFEIAGKDTSRCQIISERLHSVLVMQPLTSGDELVCRCQVRPR